MVINADFSHLKGKTLIAVEVLCSDGDGDCIRFTTSDYHRYDMCHIQDCCESVTLEEVIGDWDDVLFSPILLAEKVTNKYATDDPPEDADDSYIWTFYKLATEKGKVTLRWFGTSNGYYSEDVDFLRIEDTSFKEYFLSIRKGVLNEEWKC